MAKQKIDLPSAELGVSSWDSPRTDIKQCIEEAKEKVMSTIGYSPAQAETTGYVSRHIDVKMNRDQASKFKSLMRKLEDEGKQLKDGTPVNNKRRAVLWLIENC